MSTVPHIKDTESAFPSAIPDVNRLGMIEAIHQAHGMSQRVLLAGMIASGLVRQGADVPVLARMALVLADEILRQDREDTKAKDYTSAG